MRVDFVIYNGNKQGYPQRMYVVSMQLRFKRALLPGVAQFGG